MNIRVKAEDVETPIGWPKLEEDSKEFVNLLHAGKVKREDDVHSDADTETDEEEKKAWEIIRKNENVCTSFFKDSLQLTRFCSLILLAKAGS